LAAVSLVAMPVVAWAQNPAASLSLSKSVRVGKASKKKNGIAQVGIIIGVLAVAGAAGGIAAATSSSN
ncbi:hypothetical protein AB0127_25880, partial [Klebsiella pneumoniae]